VPPRQRRRNAKPSRFRSADAVKVVASRALFVRSLISAPFFLEFVGPDGPTQGSGAETLFLPARGEFPMTTDLETGGDGTPAVPKEATRLKFSGYQKFVVALLAFLQFSIILDFMIISPLGAIIMRSPVATCSCHSAASTR
jgi:hypothetical protein